MGVREQIHDTPEMKARKSRQEAGTTQSVDTVGEAVGPVISLEKSDLEFWVQVAQLVVLIMLLRRM